MTRKKKITNLFRRMLRILLPGCALPLLMFGYFAISSHFESLKQSHIKSSERVLAFMAAEFDGMTAELHVLMKNTSADDVLKSDNAFAIQESLTSWYAANALLEMIYVLDVNGMIVATQPMKPEIFGKAVVASRSANGDELAWYPLREGTEISALEASPSQSYKRVYFRRPIFDFSGQNKGFLVVRVNLAPWFERASHIISRIPDVIGAVLPDATSSSAVQVGKPIPLWWERVAKLRGEGELNGPIDLLGEDYYALQKRLPNLSARIVLAEPLSAIYRSPRQVLFGSLAVMACAFAILAGLIFLMVRSIVEPISVVAQAAVSFSGGDLDVRIPVNRDDEVGILAHSFNNMADSIKQSQFRTRALYQSIRELFSCDDVNAVLRKAVELSCTQCHGVVAWFVPHNLGRDEASAKKSGHRNGWMWKNRHIQEIDIRQANSAWDRRDDDRVYAFVMRNHNDELGILKVAYATQPSQMVESILHSLMTLVETALEKQELIRNNALVLTELEIAETVQRNMLSDRMLESKQASIAYHYQPASRLGGDWFYIIEDQERDALWVLMGDVTGHGLPQGLVTTAVKGALDVVDWLIKAGDRTLKGPADVLTMLDQVVARALGKSKLAMTCVALKIDFKLAQLTCCNAGHTFPIHIHHQDGVSWARHLQKEQQPVLGTAQDPDYRYHDTKYELKPGDLLVVYTDGLAEAKSLDSKVFGRFLFRKLRQRRDFVQAETLKSEILDMFQYYTQGASIEDDVCFLIVQMNPYNMTSGYKGVS